METCLKCKYRSECEEHYGKIGEEGEDCTAVGGTHLCKVFWKQFYKDMKKQYKNSKVCQRMYRNKVLKVTKQYTGGRTPFEELAIEFCNIAKLVEKENIDNTIKEHIAARLKEFLYINNTK